MSFKYLDSNGLSYFWSKIVAKINAEKGVSAVNPTGGSVDATITIPTKTSDLINDSGFVDSTAMSGKQDTLVSGTNIKTINNTSLLGSGNISTPTTDVKINNTSIVSSNSANIVTNTAYNASTNKIATMSDVPTNTNQLTNGAGFITSSSLTDYVGKSGTTMTGALVAQNNTNYTTAQVRNVVFSTSEPTSSQGGNGDIWIVYS
jgi:hypothetical protein